MLVPSTRTCAKKVQWKDGFHREGQVIFTSVGERRVFSGFQLHIETGEVQSNMMRDREMEGGREGGRESDRARSEYLPLCPRVRERVYF